MKKFLKIFLPIICGLGGMALALCYIFIPQETKSAADIVIGYLNTPLGIAGGSSITFGLVVYIIVKSIGKYLINSNKINIDELRQEFEKAQEKTKWQFEKLSLYSLELTRNIEETDKKIEEVEGVVKEICKTSPNAKIKAIEKEFIELAKVREERRKLVENYGKREETTND